MIVVGGFCDVFLWQLFILCQLFLLHCSHIPSYLTQRIPDEGGWIMIVTRNKEDMSYKKHDKTRFETNVQTLWVENTYDFYIDIIRWYFDLRRRNEWKILVMLLVSNFLFRTLIHLIEVKTSCVMISFVDLFMLHQCRQFFDTKKCSR